MKLTIAVFLLFSNLPALWAGWTELHPAGMGPFDDSRDAKRDRLVREVFQLERDIEGYRFEAVHCYDDESAFAVIVQAEERGEGGWKLRVLRAREPLARSTRSRVSEGSFAIDREIGVRMHAAVVEALLRTRYVIESKNASFDIPTGGGETFIAARPNRTFLAGFTWAPVEGSVAWHVERLVLGLGSYRETGTEGLAKLVEGLESAIAKPAAR